VTAAPGLEMVSHTHPGQVRSHNEDSLSCVPDLGLAILADGMGGYNAGEVASGICVSLLGEELRQALSDTRQKAKGELDAPAAENLLREHILRANTSVYRAAQSQPEYSGMGTTLVMGLFQDERVTVAHIGDSRLYRLRGDSLEQLTRDHSLLQEQIDNGIITREQARVSQNKNLVTRALGVGDSVEPEIRSYEIRGDDVYLFCSDGLNDMVVDEDIRSAMMTLQSNLQLAANHLVDMANDAGGRDNVSVILVKVRHEIPSGHGVATRLLSWLRK